MKKTVILLHPRVFGHERGGIPLGPLMIAATLLRAGFKPVIIDQATDANYLKTISRNPL